MGKIENIFIVIALAMASFLVLMTGAFDPIQGSEPARGGIDDPLDCTVYIYDINEPYYPGDRGRLYVSIYNEYDGTGYEGSGSPGNESTIKEVKVSYIGLFKKMDGSPAPHQTNLDQFEFYNNGGPGYEMTQYQTKAFYGAPDDDYIEFSVNMENVAPGDYMMRFQASLRYMVNWDGGSQYDWITTAVTFEKSFEIRSYIAGDGGVEYNFYAFDENYNTENLYAGARNERFGIRSLYSTSGTITDIEATIAFPGTPIIVRQPVLNFGSMISTIVWNIDVPGDLAPGVYPVQIQMTYLRNGEIISEAPRISDFTVEYTPLLMPPEFNDLGSPFAIYTQKNLPTSIQVPFFNVGNVDLYDIVVSLDTSNTRYVKNDGYWFDENSNSNTVYDNLEFKIDSIPVGEQGMATFQVVNFLPRLPPGLYKIPIDYYAVYHDDGGTGNTPGEMVSGYWNEKGYYEHRNIMRDIEFPYTNDEHIPYLLIRIADDPMGPEITGYIDSGNNAYPGTVNQYMRLRVENNEMYYFYNLEYRIHIDDGSPFNHPYAHENYTGNTLPVIYRGGLSETSGTGVSSDAFYFYANIREDAMPGINFFKVDVEGVNEWNEPFNHTFVAYITIRANQPRFQEIGIEVGDILDDRSVEVTVEIQNMGMGGAHNLSCYFDYTSSGYLSMGGASGVGDVGPGDTFFYSFKMKPDGERRYFDGSFSGNVYFAFYDDLGEFDEMFSGNSISVRFDIYDKLPDIRIIHVDAPLVDRDKEFTVSVTIMNFGGTTAEDLSILLPYDSNQFRILEGAEQDIGEMEAGETVELEFRMKAQDEISDGTTYTFYIYFSYTDVQGRTRTFSEAPSDAFSIRIKDRIIPSETQTVVKDDGVIISDGAGSFLLGIMILIAVIVFVRMTRGTPKMEIKNVQEQPRDDIKRSRKMDMEKDTKKIELVDEEEDEQEEEEEEDDEEDDEDWH
ncbi:MAG: hypothetical protein ACMUHM_03860 [Thermoplasmatota archaeon]